MKTKQITVSYSRTVNLGDFHGIKVALGQVADIEDGDNVEECYHALFEMLKEETKKEIFPVARQYKTLSLGVVETFRGKPIVEQENSNAD